jgi:hypothetical protein
MRLLIKSRAEIQFMAKRKIDILNQGNGFYSFSKVVSLKHILSYCSYRDHFMTRRYDNIGQLIVQAIQATNRNDVIKCSTDLYLHWNQELRLSDGMKTQIKTIKSLISCW